MTPLPGPLGRLEAFLKTDLYYLARSGFWINLSVGSVTLFSLALYLVFARTLPKETFGTYQYLLSLGAILGALTLTGMNTAVTSAVARGAEGALKTAVRLQLRYAFLPIGAAALGSLYYFLNDNMVLGAGLLVVGIATPLINAWNTYSAFLLGKRDFRAVFLYNFATNVPFYGILIIAALLTDSPLVLIALNMLVQTLGFYFAYRATLRAYKPSDESQEDISRYGFHLSVMGGLATLAQQADAVLAFHFLGAAGLAVYAFATAIPERLGGLFKFLPMAALPKFANRDETSIRNSIGRRLLIALPFTLLLAGAYALVAPYLFALLFPAYIEAVPYSQWYGLAVAGVLTQILVSALSAHERVARLYAFNIGAPLVALTLQTAGAVTFGLAGLVGGKLLGLLFALVFALVLVLMPSQEAAASVP